MAPEKEWMGLYEKVKEKTACPFDLNTYFELPEIAGKHLTTMDIGVCDLPSGKILVCDPLVFLGDRNEEPFLQKAPAGTYHTEVCVIKPDEDGDCARYAAVRLRFSKKRPVSFYQALIGHENLEELENEDDEYLYFGFGVDAGLGCICDEQVHKIYCDWSDKWDREHPGDNQYDDYFADLFAENYKKNPEFQRDGGDWLNWKIPGTEYHIPIFESGFGDGIYPVYWGVDETGMICQLVIHFINIELEYGESK